MRTDRQRGDEGFTMIAVVTFSMLIVFLTTALLADAVSQNRDANRQKRDDQLIASAEAIIDRYASKLTVNPVYYLQRVDESERARTCTQVGHPQNGVEVAAGNAWIDGCAEWDYLTDPVDADWFEHPLLQTEENVQTLIEVSPPASGGGVEVNVVGRITNRDQYRAISADIEAVSLAEFVRVTQNDLAYGSGAVLTGKVYSGGNLEFGTGATVRADIHAEGIIIDDADDDCPTFENGAEAFDSVAGNCNADDIRTVFPDALDFGSFWDDVDRLEDIACGGSGICLSGGYDAYLVHPFTSGGVDRIAIWGANGNPPMHAGCTASTEGRWFNLVHDPAVTWVSLGTQDVPGNGVLWADGHIVLGNRGPNPASPSGGTITISGGLTVVAGTQAAPKNLIYNAEVVYSDPNSFDVIGMIATDECVINPYAVGADRTLDLRGAILSQDDRWIVAWWCGDVNNGDTSQFSSSTGAPVQEGTGGVLGTLNVTGSIASPGTGNPSGSFSPRNYGFDERFVFLRPPFYPLVGDDWSYENWSEDFIPDWAR